MVASCVDQTGWIPAFKLTVKKTLVPSAGWMMFLFFSFSFLNKLHLSLHYDSYFMFSIRNYSCNGIIHQRLKVSFFQLS
ncbi:hypothetical protein SRHO_G00177130 [Serrasalmus rhombeus]